MTALSAEQQAELGHFLLATARHQITAALGLPSDPPNPAALAAPCQERLAESAATFVTLTLDGQLRGCIGRLEASRSLLDDLCANARAAAFSDPRFPPLTADELAHTHLEVSLLSAPYDLPVSDEADACRQLRPGIDGVILSAGHRRATFLPQVWTALPAPYRFLAELKLKAGLPASGWSPSYRLSCYQVQQWQEEPPPSL